MAKFNNCLLILDKYNESIEELKEEDCCCEYSYLYARELGDLASQVWIKYCPFCGRKLSLSNISINICRKRKVM